MAERDERIRQLRGRVEAGEYDVDSLAVADAILHAHGVEPSPPSLRPVNRLLDVVRGFLMGSADVVPGVSGGTVALVLGIYPRLVSNIRLGSHALGRLIRGDGKGFRSRLKAVDWPFLLSILAGIAIAIVALASVIGTLRDDYPIETSGLFFGLVAASIFIAWGLISRPGMREAVVATVAAVAVFLVLGVQSGPIAEPTLVVVFVAGAVAICAMILPGVRRIHSACDRYVRRRDRCHSRPRNGRRRGFRYRCCDRTGVVLLTSPLAARAPPRRCDGRPRRSHGRVAAGAVAVA
ncbi:MAG: DUF368 domain-containing protein [Acidimicrobiia bacterium]|nr:DUF368 domain-containing protein [Acidimicrobiia bacterium]